MRCDARCRRVDDPGQRSQLQTIGIVLLADARWINACKMFRYFVLPMMSETLPSVPDAAPIDPGVFALWPWLELAVAALVVDSGIGRHSCLAAKLG